MSDYIAIRVGQCIVGSVHGASFVKKVHSSRHFLRTPPGIALDVQSLVDAERAGAITVKIVDLDSGRVYLASISLIRDKGFRLDRGYGQQIVLPLECWHIEGSPEQLQLRA